MAGKNQVTLTFAGDSNKLSKTFAQVGRDSAKFENSLTKSSARVAAGFKSMAKVAAVGLTATGVALAAFGKSAIGAAEELNSIRSRTDAVIASTGGAANVSSQQVKAYAKELQTLAAVDRKLIENSQNVLLTFTKVRNEVGKGNDVFDQATLAALNMSAALGTDLQSATVMMGKALNDPIAGITAMTRAGVQFTGQQKDQIRAMVAAGDVLGAQKIILAEMETQFGGSAAASADSSEKIRLAFLNLKEDIGMKLLPMLDALADWVVAKGIPALTMLADWVGDEVVPRLKELGAWLGVNVLPALRTLGAFLVGTVVPALVKMARWLGENQKVLASVAIGITALLVPAFIAWAVAAAASAAATLVAMAPLVLLGVAVAAIAYLILTHWDTIKAATSAVWNFVKNLTVTIWDGIKAVVSAVLGGIWSAITAYFNLYRTVITTAWNVIRAVTSAVWNGIKAVVVGIWNTMVTSVRTQINNVVSLMSGIGGRLRSALGTVADAITAPFRTGFKAIRDIWNSTIGGKGFDVPSWVPGVGGQSFKIPKLAEGGIVNRPTLALIGEAGPEAVVPLDRYNSGGGGGPVVIDIHSGGTAMDDLLVEVLRRAIRVRGGNVSVVLGG
jgi:hypothetical protein